MGRAKRIWYLSPMRAAKVQASLRIRAVSPEPSLLVHTSSESRGTFRQKARSLSPLNGWACAVKICHDGMLEDTNSLDGAQMELISEREKLDELIPDGKQLMHDIDDAVEPLKDTVTLYLMGTHAAIEDKLMKESLIASSRCGFKKNNRVTKQSVNEEDCIQNLATKPSVIIYVVPSAGRRGRRLKVLQIHHDNTNLSPLKVNNKS